MSRTCSTYRTDEKSIKILVGKLDGKRTLGRPRRGWEDWNGCWETGWEGVVKVQVKLSVCFFN
jgi:hypothetical protein